MLSGFLLLAAVGLLLTRRSPDAETRLFEPGDTNIRCPRCGWQPARSSRWYCDPGCLHQWNTFDTAGVCPSCAKEWQDTACLRCRQWSPHADWYERPVR